MNEKIIILKAPEFAPNVTPRKSSIKLMIQEELTKLADDEDGEEDGEKDGTQSAGQELDARPTQQGEENNTMEVSMVVSILCQYVLFSCDLFEIAFLNNFWHLIKYEVAFL